MRNDMKEAEDTKKTIRAGALTAAIFCWIIVIGLMVFYYYTTTLENYHVNQYAASFFNQIQVNIEMPIFLTAARMIAYAFLAAFSYAAIDVSSKIKKTYAVKKDVKIAFLRITVAEMLAFWIVFLFSACIEYYLLFVPGHSADMYAFFQNLSGALIALFIIRIVLAVSQFIRYLFARRK